MNTGKIGCHAGAAGRGSVMLSLSLALALALSVSVSVSVSGCATNPESNRTERNLNATVLTVEPNDSGARILGAIPQESIMDRFDTLDTQGRLVSYVAFTDTDTGALVFVDDKFHGMLSRHDAQAFYVCRGHTMVTPDRYWATEAKDWVDSLLASTRPASAVTLEFSGKSAAQSIKEVSENPVLSSIKSFFGMGSNPLGIINTLNTAQSGFEASEQFAHESKGLHGIRPGMNEARLAEAAKPQDLGFLGGGMVLAYPTHRIEFFVAGGATRVIQQPSFYYLFRTHAALFYAPGTDWPLCTAKRWKDALPKTAEDGKTHRDPAAAVKETPKAGAAGMRAESERDRSR